MPVPARPLQCKCGPSATTEGHRRGNGHQWGKLSRQRLPNSYPSEYPISTRRSAAVGQRCAVHAPEPGHGFPAACPQKLRTPTRHPSEGGEYIPGFRGSRLQDGTRVRYHRPCAPALGHVLRPIAKALEGLLVKTKNKYKIGFFAFSCHVMLPPTIYRNFPHRTHPVFHTISCPPLVGVRAGGGYESTPRGGAVAVAPIELWGPWSAPN